MKKVNNIQVRHFSGSSIPVASAMGKILINSVDSRSISKAILHLKNGETKNIQISQSTKDALELALGK